MASPAFRRQASLSLQDMAMQHLQSNHGLTWQPVGDGHYVDIPVDSYDQAMAAVNGSQSNRDRRGLFDNDGGGTPNAGTVLGYDISQAVCYNKGTLSEDSVVSLYAVSACDIFISNTLPPPALGALRIWQSAQSPDVAGDPFYVRYGLRLLKPSEIVNKSLCQAAFTSLWNNYCQNGNGVTQGGELDVGKVVRFSADPTEVATNR